MYEGGNGRLNVVWCSPGSVALVVVAFEVVVEELLVFVWLDGVVSVFPLLEWVPAEVLVLSEFNLPTELAVVVELAPSLLSLVFLVDAELAEFKDLAESSNDNSRNPRIIGRA